MQKGLGDEELSLLEAGGELAVGVAELWGGRFRAGVLEDTGGEGAGLGLDFGGGAPPGVVGGEVVEQVLESLADGGVGFGGEAECVTDGGGGDFGAGAQADGILEEGFEV
ncbi:MAG: hypothetical protein RI897_1821 [Verrucomicrobiota bacterium]